MVFCGCRPCFQKEEVVTSPATTVTTSGSTLVTAPPAKVEVIRDGNTEEKGIKKQQSGIVAREVWQTAFDELRADKSTQALVLEYEEFVRYHLSTLASCRNKPVKDLVVLLADLNEGDRETIILRLAEHRLKEINESKTQLQIFATVSKIMGKVKATVGNALCFCPPAAAGWALACLIVMPVTEHAEQTNANKDGLSYIVSKLPWYTHLIELVNADTWSETSAMRECQPLIRSTIIELYKLLIEYQLRTFYVRNHRVVAIASNTVRWDVWEGKLAEIQKIEATLMEHIETHSQADIRAKFHQLLKDTEKLRQELSALLGEQVRLLRGIDSNLRDIRDDTRNKSRRETWDRFKLDRAELDLGTYEEYVDGLEKVEPGTGSGVLEHPLYIDWRRSDQGLLILAARPGTGKSVLAKHIRDQLATSRDQIVCSFFFKDNTSGQTDPNKALCKIFFDLLKELSKLPGSELLSDEIDKLEKEDIRPECRRFWSIMSTISQQRTVTIVLDALDEAAETKRSGLLERLGSFQPNFPQARVKFIVTTRPLKDVSCELKQFTLNMDNDSDCREAIQNDIFHVAGKKLDRFARYNEINSPTRGELLSIVKDHQDSTYLFIKLLFTYVEKAPRRFDQDWAEVFKALPVTVSQAYGALLAEVNEGNRPLVKAMIKIVLAATRPMTVTEMKIAAKLQLRGRMDCRRKEDFVLQSDGFMENVIREDCGFLFDIVAGRIYFIHLTVKDYLLSLELENERPDWLRQIDLGDCHRTLAQTCMNYISLPFIAEDPGFKNSDEYLELDEMKQSQYHRWCKDSFEFGRYGFANWILHFKQGRKDTQNETALLDEIAAGHSRELMELAINIFCCSALPSRTEIQAFHEAVPEDHPRRVEMLTALSQSLVENYFRSAGFVDLLCGIELAELAVYHSAVDDRKLAKRLGILAEALMRKYERDGVSLTLHRAVLMSEKAVLIARPESPARAYALHQRANCLRNLHEETDETEHLNQAILDCKEALTISPTSYHYHVTLAGALYSRSTSESALEDLDAAVQTLKSVLAHMPEGTAYKSLGLHEQGTYLLTTYDLRGNTEDLLTSIEMLKESVRVSVGNNMLHHTLEALASALNSLYEAGRDEQALLGAIEALEKAIKTIDDGHTDYARLSEALRRLHEEKMQLQEEQCST
ncbi:hypothetical protein BDW59DRAFT_152384 [Aspergillus cavernicola]|uniref:NACHT domain-containing protein n=1 Tax=Aspergillus cavernicola TaxID=176166 RepID=A0ABR4HS20_9EURO